MKNIYKAIASFQQEVPVIFKDTTGYGYKYADLPQILAVINPLLKKHKLGFTQLMDGECLKTIIFHIESGEEIESCAQIPQGVQLKNMNDFQVLGSAITYIRRYALSAALGLVTDKDTDAHGEQTKGAENSLKWLNPNTTEWTNAVAKKVSLDKVKQHYKISKENEVLYLKEIKK